MTAEQPSSKRISLPHLLIVLPWVALVIQTLDSINDNSYLWHITAGDVQRDAGHVLTTDPFSFTMMGESWLTQSWLAELLYSVAHDVFGIGFTGVMLVLASLVAVGGMGLIIYGRSSSVPALGVFLILSTLLFLVFLVPRPVLFSYPLFVLVVLAWDRPALRWTLPFLMWTWASVHGSFAIGLVYVGLMWLSEKEWKQWPHLLAAGLATLFTAHGLGVLTMLWDFATARPYLAMVSEWRTPDFLSITLLPFLVGLVFIVYGSMKGRLRPQSLWIIVPFLLLGASATRAVGTAWIALLPLMAQSLKGLSWNLGNGFARPVGVGLAVVMLGFPFLFTRPVVLEESRFPLAAVEHLEDVRTFHDDASGGYLIYAGQFSEGVFIDDRVELYRELIREFVAVRNMREPWHDMFEREGVDQVLLRVDEPLAVRLQEVGWTVSYEDDHFVVLLPG